METGSFPSAEIPVQVGVGLPYTNVLFGPVKGQADKLSSRGVSRWDAR